MEKPTQETRIVNGAKSLADNIIDDIPYKVEEFFGGDSVSKDISDLFYKTLKKHLTAQIKKL